MLALLLLVNYHLLITVNNFYIYRTYYSVHFPSEQPRKCAALLNTHTLLVRCQTSNGGSYEFQIWV